MCTAQLLARAVRALPAGNGRLMHVALSGGVDSSVAALLLRDAGWAVRPVLMRCWTEANGAGCFERDSRAAQQAATALELPHPLAVFDLTREYWLDVFAPVFLRGLADGITPNPDVACNARVKFGAFPERLRAETGGKETPMFATGHYARTQDGVLHTAVDALKDQTYFLAGVAGKHLKAVTFPLGGLRKTETREIAKWAALPAAESRSTRGICFVGKKKIAPFVMQYLPEQHIGCFVDENGGVVGDLPVPAWAFTVGQRARIGGQSTPLFVAGKDAGDVLVVRGKDHPALFMSALKCDHVHWVAGRPPIGSGDVMELVAKTNSCGAFYPCRIALNEGGGIGVEFNPAVRRVAPGQLVALYDGDVCLGGGLVSK